VARFDTVFLELLGKPTRNAVVRVFSDQDTHRYSSELFDFVCRGSCNSVSSNVFVPRKKLIVISFDVRLSWQLLVQVLISG
jgi:hypothetical protein